MITVIKRNETRQEFSRDKIKTAIMKAVEDARAINKEVNAELMESVAGLISLDVAQSIVEDEVHVDRIHDTVEKLLMSYAPAEVAKQYVLSRYKKLGRKAIDIVKAVEGVLRQTDTATMNENSNKDARVIPVQRDMLAGVVAKEYALEHMLPKSVAKAHKDGAIHFHDLDYSPYFPMYNCMIIDVEGMLTAGFKMGNTQIETPKSFYVACQVTAQIIAQVASHIYGGNTINGIDRILAPYVKKSFVKHYRTGLKYVANLQYPEPTFEMLERSFGECEYSNTFYQEYSESVYKYATDMTVKEVYDGIQALEYEVNTLFTANGQSPFTTFGIESGLSWEEREIQKAIFQNRIRGIGKDGKTAIFPKLVYKQEEGNNLNPEDPNYDIRQLALKCSALRMYPDILNAPLLREVTGGYKAPMGCRSFLGEHVVNGKRVVDGRMNLGVVSVNLPQIALRANSEEEFYAELDKVLDIAYEGLMYRVHRFDGVKAEVAPILYCEGATGHRLNPQDEISTIFKNGFASVSLGYIGVHETILALHGKKVFGDAELQHKAEMIVAYLGVKTKQWKEQTGYGFSLYSTPSESLCNRFCKIDSDTFGIVEGITDKGYYTNSFHLDVAEKTTVFNKMDFESVYPKHASGGFISFVEIPSLVRNIEALDELWRYSYTRNPYFAVNTPTDRCFECKYEGEFTAMDVGYECPNCGNHEPKRMSVIRRCCGYLSEPSDRPFNEGKQKEVLLRVKHM